MSIVKSLSVGDGDMFYIKHGSDSFTIIDCCLPDDDKPTIVNELKSKSAKKRIKRFISTHPDEDHIQGIRYLDEKMPINNFYCVRNEASKDDITESFEHYCSLRDGDNSYYVKKGCSRRWLNQGDKKRRGAGLRFLWPDVSNVDYKEELQNAKSGQSFNNISLVLRYSAGNNATFVWCGDLETEFMEKIRGHISLSRCRILFASHHGRESGKVPDSWLDDLRPKIIVIGEAASRHLHYYTDYHTITQNSAGDITFDCADTDKIHIYCSNEEYNVDFLDLELDIDEQAGDGHYLGTLNF